MGIQYVLMAICVDKLPSMQPLYTGQLNPLHAKFFRGNKNIYLHFMSFFHIDMSQEVEIFLKQDKDPPILYSQ